MTLSTMSIIHKNVTFPTLVAHAEFSSSHSHVVCLMGTSSSRGRCPQPSLSEGGRPGPAG